MEYLHRKTLFDYINDNNQENILLSSYTIMKL